MPANRSQPLPILALAGLSLALALSTADGAEPRPAPRAGMVRVPEGAFVMGATPGQQAAALGFGWTGAWRERIGRLVGSAGPAHTVQLDSYFIDIFEVTNRRYDAFLRATGQAPPSFRFEDPDLPVVGVSWYDADAYCAWAGKRLPTEAEWEKAARGTEGLSYPWGNTWDAARLRSAEIIAGRPLASFGAWTRWRRQRPGMFTEGSTSRPAAVGSHPAGASPYGVMDMAGNVWEWTADWYDPASYAVAPERNPKGPAAGNRRVLRGGAWDVPRVAAYTWFRETFMPPEEGRGVTGFRCAMGVKENLAGRPPAAGRQSAYFRR